MKWRISHLRWYIVFCLAVILCIQYQKRTKESSAHKNEHATSANLLSNAKIRAESNPNTLSNKNQSISISPSLLHQRNQNWDAPQIFASFRDSIIFSQEQWIKENITENDLPHLEQMLESIISFNQKEINEEVMIEHINSLKLVSAIIEYSDHQSLTDKAKQGLELIVAEPFPQNANHILKKHLIGNKYDALEYISRFSPDDGLYLFETMSHNFKELLQPAIISGLVAAGFDREQAISETNLLIKD